MSIIVNGTEIPESAIDQEVQYHPAPSLDAARTAAAQALVIRHLLLEEAGRLGLFPSAANDDTDPAHAITAATDDDDEALTVEAAEQEDNAIQALLSREIEVPEPDEVSCRRYFEQNRAKFRSASLFEAAHILFPAAASDAGVREAARLKAEETITLLQQNPDRFAELAMERSACPSAADGGHLGQISHGQTVPEFETFLEQTPAGTLCPVAVPTRFGYHVLRVDRRIDGREVDFPMVQERIADYLRQASWQRAAHQYIQILVGRAKIDGIIMEGASSPLVQ